MFTFEYSIYDYENMNVAYICSCVWWTRTCNYITIDFGLEHSSASPPLLVKSVITDFENLEAVYFRLKCSKTKQS